MKNKRALFFRFGTVLVLLVIAAVMMMIGRGHTVYLDNKSLEYGGQTYAAPYKVVVNVKGEQIAKLYDKERGMTTCIGQELKISVEVTETKGGGEETAEYVIKLPYNIDGVIINLPAYFAGLPEEAYLSRFVPAVTEEPAEETPVTDEFGLMDGGTEAGE